MFDNSQIERFKNCFNPKNSWAIIPHLNPDGDAIGSSLAFWHLLKDMGIEAHVVVPDSTPDFLKFVAGIEHILIAKKQVDFCNRIIEEADVLLILDHNDFLRSGSLSDAVIKNAGTKIMIDHHPAPVIKASEAILFSNISLSSTCELALELMVALGYGDKISKDVANALMTGMITDTGSFSYNCSTGEFFNNVALLLDKGAEKDYIIDCIYNQHSQDRMRLIGYLLSQKMEVFPEINTAIISLNWSEMHRFNFKKGDSEGVVNMPLSIKGIDFSVFISVRDDKTKLSFRSKGAFPANKIAAEYFSGGGHLNAAGGSSELNVEDTIKYFKTLFPKIKRLL